MLSDEHWPRPRADDVATECEQAARDREERAMIKTMRVEIIPGITRDSERAFDKPVIAGTRVTAAQVLASLASGRSDAEIRAEHQLTSEQIRAVLRYAAMLADQNLDTAFAAMWSDPERNAAEAALDHRCDDEIDAGAGFRGSVDELLSAVDA
jgi:uncharacterized protein (DUF433 family)